MPTPLTQIIAVAFAFLVVILIYQSKTKSQVNYHLKKIAIEQPLDHNHRDGPIFIQHVEILFPVGARADSPVLFVLGGESVATTRRLVGLYKAYGQRPDLILIQAEHRGYGNSLSLDADQTIPAYVTVDQALADFHAVIQNLKQTYTGIWMAAGYSYSGGLVIELAARYPDDIVAVLSSSGVVDWPFTMQAYDAKVRVIFGKATYNRLVTHINKLQPQAMFDRDWLEREFLIAFIHGVSQFTAFRPYRPVFNAATWLPTPVLLAILHGLDRAIAQQGAWNYAISNSKLSLSREEALTMRYTWRTWRYQQANETGIFEVSASPEGIFNRTEADFIAEARCLFGKAQPRSLQAEAWSPRTSLAKLTVPLIYVAGEFDPWEGLGIERDYPLQSGRYFLVPGGLHCPDVYDRALGHEVISALLQFAQLSYQQRG